MKRHSGFGPDGSGAIYAIARDAARGDNLVSTFLDQLSTGIVYFSDDNTQGCNPCEIACEPTPVRPTTWGAIKKVNFYREEE